MNKKTLILGIFVTLLVSSGAGVSSGQAQVNNNGQFAGLFCTPSSQVASSGERIHFSAHYGYDHGFRPQYELTWSAVGGRPATGSGDSFSTRFSTSSISETRVVTVTDGYQAASCIVYVYGSPTPTPTPAPTWFSVDHSVRNMTRSRSGTSVTAYNGDRLQFITRITIGGQYAEDVHIRDWLPQYANYVYGSTTVDGAWYPDGIATGNSHEALSLGTLSPNRTYVVRFDATVSGASTVTRTNSVNVHVRGAADQNRTSTISFVGPAPTPTPSWTPTPTPYPTNGTLALSLAARNITLGQSREYATVSARAGNTIEFILRVRSQAGSTLWNVYVTDYLPAGLSYIRSSTALNGYVVADSITSSGLNIGSLAPGQEAVIRFSALVDGNSVPSWGTVTVSDTAQARADGTGTVSASVKLLFGRSSSLVSVSGIQTGPADALALALAIATLATGIYAVYTRSGAFNTRLAASEVGRIRGGTPNFLR